MPSLALINALLPSELLLEIFRALVDYNSDPCESRSRYIHCPRAWRVSHVCRYWRTLALSLPELWVIIPGSFSTEIAGLFASRSESKPLDIGIYFPCSEDARTALIEQLLEPVHSRLCTLAISGISWGIHELLTEYSWNANLPLLQHLTLHSQPYGTRKRFRIQLSGFELAERLSDLQSLVSLSLSHGFVFTRRFSLPPNLRVLEIGGGSDVLHTQINASTLLGALATCMGALEILRMEVHCLLDLRINNSVPLTPICLSRLRRFYLKSPATSVSQNFLSSISMPAVRHVGVSLYLSGSIDWSTYYDVLAAVRPLLPACGSTCFVSGQPGQERSFVMMGGYKPIGWSQPKPLFEKLSSHDNTAYALSTKWPFDADTPDNRTDFLMALLAAAHPEHVHELALRLKSSDSLYHRAILAAFPEVKVLAQLDNSVQFHSELYPNVLGDVQLPKLRMFVSTLPPSVNSILAEQFFKETQAALKIRKEAGWRRPGLVVYNKTKSAKVDSFIDNIRIRAIQRGKGVREELEGSSP